MSSGRSGGLPACGFLVQATKAGSLPLSIERRALGKKVTVIGNVQGNAEALQSTLATMLGVGGTIHEKGKLAEVEVQGEQVERVSKILMQLACVRGLPKTKETAAHVVADCQIDGGTSEGRRKPRHSALAAGIVEPPSDAPCRSWHGYWPYCSGSCGSELFSEADLWCIEPPPTPPPPKRSPPGKLEVNIDNLSAALQRLGMRSEPGAAVLQWVTKTTAAVVATEKRRSAPQVSMCAPGHAAVDTGQTYICKECGASFSRKQTLAKHIQQHQREREQGDAQPQLNADGAWRQSNVALEAWEPGWESIRGGDALDYDWEFSDEDCPQSAPRSGTASLASFIDIAVKKRGSSKAVAKSAKSSSTSKDAQAVPCPICGQTYALGAMDAHVDVCLAMTASVNENSTSSSRPAIKGTGKKPSSEDSIPVELLQSLLEMDLPPAAAEYFWDCFGDLSASGNLPFRECFLQALDRAFSSPDFSMLIELGNSSASGAMESPTVVLWNPDDDDDEQIKELASPEFVEDQDDFCAVGRGGRWKKNRPSPPVQEAESGSTNVSGVPKKGISLKSKRCNLRFAAAQGYYVTPSSPAPAVVPTPSCSPQSSPVTITGGSAGKSAPAPIAAASQSNKPSESASKSASVPVAQAQNGDGLGLDAWLRSRLEPVLGAVFADGVATGIDLILSNADDDPDAHANAIEILAAELSSIATETSEQIVLEFQARLVVAS